VFFILPRRRDDSSLPCGLSYSAGSWSSVVSALHRTHCSGEALGLRYHSAPSHTHYILRSMCSSCIVHGLLQAHSPPTYVCMCASMHVCIYICVYGYMHACMHVSFLIVLLSSTRS
jgi:hypothetical protein